MQRKDGHKLLQLKGITKFFGGIGAVQGLDLEILHGEIVGLIGPNGAGKTTAFNLISGVTTPTTGQVIFEGVDITKLKPSAIAKKGLVRTFQSNVLFKDSTVMENLLLGLHLHTHIEFFSDLLNTFSNRNKERQVSERAEEIIKFMGLEKYHRELAKNLPHGHQRALGIAIALAAGPKILMLDEPTGGMNLEEKQAIMNLVRRIQEKGIAVLLVEHDMKVVMELCERVAVLNFGKKIAEGTPEEIKVNGDVIEAYLGVE